MRGSAPLKPALDGLSKLPIWLIGKRKLLRIIYAELTKRLSLHLLLLLVFLFILHITINGQLDVESFPQDYKDLQLLEAFEGLHKKKTKESSTILYIFFIWNF